MLCSLMKFLFHLGPSSASPSKKFLAKRKRPMVHGHPDQKILGKTFELAVELATSFEGTITTKMRVKPTDTVSKIRERLAAAAARSRGPPPPGVVPIDVDGDGWTPPLPPLQ